MNNVAVTFGVICRKEKVNLQNEGPPIHQIIMR